MIFALFLLFLIIVVLLYLTNTDVEPEIEGIQHAFDTIGTIKEFYEITGSFVDSLR
ncbi:MAG: hypothetical protein IIC67_05155 [Thaumarchaeota archaeon]|nr:hypothetical protein [Nitrososphaerota archaeon]